MYIYSFNVCALHQSEYMQQCLLKLLLLCVQSTLKVVCHVHIYVCDFICMGRGVNGVFHVCNTTVNTLTHHNLPYDLVVNSCSMAPKARRVQVILINTTDQNIWVRQPLLATELYEAEVKSQSFTVKGMKLPYHSCWHLHMRDKKQVENNTVEVEENPDPPKKNNVPVEHPKFRERPDTRKAYYLNTKLSSYHLSLIWSMLLSQNNSKIDC